MIMPELPEIEVVRRGLEKRAVGGSHFSIVHFSESAKPFRDGGVELVKQIPDAGPLETVKRCGKYLILGWERLKIAVHFGMTGQLYVATSMTKDVDPHIHLALEFPLPIMRQQAYLIYRDTRKFGWWGGPDQDRLNLLGPDALEEASSLPTHLSSVTTRRVVHSVLIDQKTVTGLGNIYVSEVCFHAGINPTRPWTQLTDVEKKALGYYIGEVMEAAIEHGGSTISDFVNADGDKGEYQLYHNVYGRGKEPCKREGCDGTVKRVEHNKRGVWLCPKCQPLNPVPVESEVEA